MENLDVLNVLQQLQDFNQHCNELLGEPNSNDNIDVLELVKKARKCDFNEMSYARKSYVEMMELNARCGLNIKYQADYDIPLDELRNKSITDLILENPSERDEYWIVDFTKDFIKNIRNEIDNDASFRWVDNQFVKVVENNPKTIRKHAKKVLNFRTEADKEYLKLIESIIEAEFDKECCGVPIVIERSLKEDLLEEDYETIQSNFEYSIEDLIEYNIYHVISKNCAKKILDAVKRLLEEGYTPKDIELKVEDNWETKISNFLNDESIVEDEDFGYSELGDKMRELDKEIIQNMKKERESERKREAKENKAAAVRDNAKKSITIKRISDGEILSFETKGECMRYLEVGYDTFSRFIKGKSKLNKKYTIESV